MMLADACADVISNDSIIAITRKGLSLIIIVVGRSWLLLKHYKDTNI